MFIDRVEIQVRAGKGGNGCVAFRREKHVPRGGPAGGNGGKGGDVILKVDSQLSTLLDFYYIHTYKAEKGKNGEGSNRHGADGAVKIVKVPPGTVVKDVQTEEIIADLVKGSVVVAKGGKGGRGNASFATSSNRAPRKATAGEPGEERTLILELKLIADIGLVGAPNAGKSTLLSRISKARPKIASYPFTTLEPNLGIVELGPDRRLVVCDIPGLIDGAHEGKGLGLGFLRHIERTRLIFLLVDITGNPVEDLDMLNDELEEYAGGILSEKPRIVVGTKIDAVDSNKNWLDILGKNAFIVSSVTGEGISELMGAAHRILRKQETE